ncbi:MAG: crossover junction endodeoxyribonuclease RuvC, partial [Nocardiopsis sp. BM-2018]
MRILGVDPGLANLGLGAIETEGSQARLLAAEVVTTRAREADGARLATLYDAVRATLGEHAIDALVVEGQFFHRQRDAAMKVGQALGVVRLAAHHAGVPTSSYGPLQVKQALVGTGRADKAQVAYMVRALLGLTTALPNHHVSDALALALTHWSAYRIGARAGREAS